MADDKAFEPFICFAVRVAGAAAEMIEEIGFLQGVRHSSAERDHKPHQMNDLRRAIAKAQRAIDSYDACMGAGFERVTGEEFEAAAKHADKAEAA
jgi:hypothetical protein